MNITISSQNTQFQILSFNICKPYLYTDARFEYFHLWAMYTLAKNISTFQYTDQVSNIVIQYFHTIHICILLAINISTYPLATSNIVIQYLNAINICTLLFFTIIWQVHRWFRNYVLPSDHISAQYSLPHADVTIVMRQIYEKGVSMMTIIENWPKNKCKYKYKYNYKWKIQIPNSLLHADVAIVIRWSWKRNIWRRWQWKREGGIDERGDDERGNDERVDDEREDDEGGGRETDSHPTSLMKESMMK